MQDRFRKRGKTGHCPDKLRHSTDKPGWNFGSRTHNVAVQLNQVHGRKRRMGNSFGALLPQCFVRFPGKIKLTYVAKGARLAMGLLSKLMPKVAQAHN
jgi:hypothetical protein